MSDPIKNPLTGQTPGLSSFDYIDKAEQTSSRVTRQGDRLGSFSTDKVGINQRRNGHWKVGSFHVFNFLSAGIVGYVGKLCANSSRMGTQKSGWWTNMVKDYGQTYLNATQDSGGFINTATKAWSVGLGSITTVGLGPLGRLIQNSAHNKAVNQTFGNHMQREFGAQLNYNSVKDLNRNAVQQSAKTMYEQIHAELQAAGNKKADAVTLTGSDSLKAAFMQARQEDFDPENVLFHQWAKPKLDKLDPQSTRHDPNYSLSKHELLTAQEDFFTDTGQYGLNLADMKRRQVQLAVHQTLGDYSQRLSQAETEVRVATNELKQNPNLQVRKNRLQTAQQNLQKIKNERLTPQQSQALFDVLKSADAAAIKMINDKIPRFRQNLQQKTQQYGGRIAQPGDDAKQFYTNIMNARPQPVDHHQTMDRVLANLQAQLLLDDPAQNPDIGRRDSDAASVSVSHSNTESTDPAEHFDKDFKGFMQQLDELGKNGTLDRKKSTAVASLARIAAHYADNGVIPAAQAYLDTAYELLEDVVNGFVKRNEPSNSDPTEVKKAHTEIQQRVDAALSNHQIANATQRGALRMVMAAAQVSIQEGNFQQAENYLKTADDLVNSRLPAKLTGDDGNDAMQMDSV